MGDVDRVVYTIGHSTHQIETFVRLLKRHGVTAVADVRSQPYSRFAHFNQDALKATLKAQGVEYVFLGRELGARREEAECYIDGQAVYERIAELPIFRDGLRRIATGAGDRTIALMCAEKEPLDCHRTILICRHLQRMGLRVRHILADGSVEEHEQTEKRLMRRVGAQATLFEQDASQAQLIERAYKARGEEIAYRLKEEVPGVSERAKREGSSRIRVFTIGSSGKSAEEFFEALRNAGVRKIVDVRLSNTSQLAGFTKKKDLQFFLRVIANIGYEHRPEFAPTKELLEAYRKKLVDWAGYEETFVGILQEQVHAEELRPGDFDQACLLCSEAKPAKCHRRLVAEYLKRHWGNVEITHL